MEKEHTKISVRDYGHISKLFTDCNGNQFDIGDVIRISKICYSKNEKHYYHSGLWRVCHDILTGISFSCIGVFDTDEEFERIKDTLEYSCIQWPPNNTVSFSKGTLCVWYDSVNNTEYIRAILNDDDYHYPNLKTDIKIELASIADIKNCSEISWAEHWRLIDVLIKNGIVAKEDVMGDENYEKRINLIKENIENIQTNGY